MTKKIPILLCLIMASVGCSQGYTPAVGPGNFTTGISPNSGANVPTTNTTGTETTNTQDLTPLTLDPQNPQSMGLQSGKIDGTAMTVNSGDLKSADELDNLLNSGQSSMQKLTKVTSDSFSLDLFFGIDFSSYDSCDNYYDYYGYDYSYDYTSYYDTYGYYDYTDYDLDFFVSYTNYEYRSPVDVWSTYSWPSGYGFITCYADNSFGDIFYGYGFPAYAANDAAIAACQGLSPLPVSIHGFPTGHS